MLRRSSRQRAHWASRQLPSLSTVRLFLLANVGKFDARDQAPYGVGNAEAHHSLQKTYYDKPDATLDHHLCYELQKNECIAQKDNRWRRAFALQGRAHVVGGSPAEVGLLHIDVHMQDDAQKQDGQAHHANAYDGFEAQVKEDDRRHQC